MALTKLPPQLEVDQLDDTPLFHWSPVARRRRIEHSGLVPGSGAVAGHWKPPFVCFGLDPALAWRQTVPYNPSVLAWDLWMTWASVPDGFEVLPLVNGDEGRVWEVRVYHRIYKRDLWMVGTRSP